MGNKYFTLEQVNELKQNPYVKNVSEKAITYTNEFKELFMLDYSKGLMPSFIFNKYGFNPQILGISRIRNAGERFRSQDKRPEGLKDTRANNPNMGRPSIKDLSQEQIIKKQQDQIEYMKQQIEFLSDLRRLEREVMYKTSKSKNKKNLK